jgi:hypothetical protein
MRRAVAIALVLGWTLSPGGILASALDGFGALGWLALPSSG